MRFFNNTSYKTLEPKIILESIAHFLICINTNEIESMEVTDDKLTVFGIDCILLEQNLRKNKKIMGKVRWYDQASGEGMIRLDSGASVHFYACNVIGADSCYPHMVTNVAFAGGDVITAQIPIDRHMFDSIGLIQVNHYKTEKTKTTEHEDYLRARGEGTLRDVNLFKRTK